MADNTKNRDGRGGKKRKQRDPKAPTLQRKKKFGGKKRKMERDEKKRMKTGPRLPSTLRKELDVLEGSTKSSDDEAGTDAEERGDVYEYEEGVPEEDTGKNRRFDQVENLEYELPDDFEDEELSSDEEIDSDVDGSERSDHDEKDEERHLRMLHGITGMPGQAFQGKKKEPVFCDVHGVDGGGTEISIQDLLDPLQGKPGYSSLRKKLHQLEKKSMAMQAPLPKVERERLERKVAYKHSKKDMTKWEPLVKRNRETPTIYFEEDVDIGYSTVGAIASEFKPRTEFEKKMALLVGNPEIVEAHQKDGSRLLELNEISIEDVKKRQNRLAKMRSLLFRHEMKSKRIKKIKSKTYHRMLNKGRLKAASAEHLMEPEDIKEQAMKQEFKRAEERMTLKHKNSSKWAKRILKRGLNAQDEGTKAAITEQLNQHALLTRKMNSMKDTSSSEDSSDDEDDDELPEDTLNGGVSKLLTSAKEKTLKVLEEEEEVPKSGVFSLPFMVRGLQRKNEAFLEEGRVAIRDYDSSLRQLENANEIDTPEFGASCGRKVFGSSRKELQENFDKVESDSIGVSSDSEADLSVKKSALVGNRKSNSFQVDLIGSGLPEEKEVDHKHVSESFEDTTHEAGPKTTYDVSIFVSDSFQKIKGNNIVDDTSSSHVRAPDNSLAHKDPEVAGPDNDMDSAEDEMVDGFFSGAKSGYEFPSQADLVHRAFAGDDVEGEFEKQKLEMLNEEVPETEKPVLVPGWGEWTRIQQKKGLPKWMVSEHEDAKRKREEALKKRKDAHLKHVIISEKIDKKVDKLHTKTLPFPFTSKEVFEQSIRMPIGPEYNTAISISALNRPAVVKKPGIIIKPIQFEEVDPHKKSAEPKPSRQNAKRNKAPGKASKKSSKGKKT